jgi:hypothetical protein
MHYSITLAWGAQHCRGYYIKVNKCNTQLLLGLFVDEQMGEGKGNKVGEP